MSEWIVLGVEPKNAHGRLFETETREEWDDVLTLLQFIWPVETVLAWMEPRDTEKLAGLLEDFLQGGAADKCLRKAGVSRAPERSLAIANSERLVPFLKDCGGYLWSFDRDPIEPRGA